MQVLEKETMEYIIEHIIVFERIYIYIYIYIWTMDESHVFGEPPAFSVPHVSLAMKFVVGNNHDYHRKGYVGL